MTQEPMVQSAESAPQVQPSAQIVHTVLRLLLAIRYRKKVVIGTMAVMALLGGLYYAMATRYYAATASMLVTQTTPDNLDLSMTSDETVRRNTMPTFEKVFTSAKVIEGALKNLSEDDKLDLAGVERRRWIETLQGNLSAKTVRNTNILEVSYRSKDPRVAMNVLNAVVQSYLDFMDEVHKGAAGDVSKVLAGQRTDLVKERQQIQANLQNARKNCGNMGFRSDSKILHPTVQRVVFCNDTLSVLQKERLELELSLGDIQRAMQSGEDIGQYIIVMCDVVGKDVLMSILGVSPREGTTHGNLMESLIQDRAQLTTLQQNLGPNHPDVIAVAERIRAAEACLKDMETQVNQRVTELGRSEVGPWFIQLGRQKLQEIMAEEDDFQKRYAEAEKEAEDYAEKLAKVEDLEHEEKRLSDLDDTLVNQLVTLKLRQNGWDVRTTLAQEPEIDEVPVSPKLSFVILFVLVGGFVAGLIGVHLLDILDDRFRSIEEMQQRLGVPVLTMVQKLDPPESTGLDALSMHSRPEAAENEAFRTLRTALALAHPNARLIVISSAEPGDGKTTVLANLAVGFAQSEKKTLLIDADLRRPGLTRLMDMRGTSGLSEVLRSEGDIAEVAAAHIQASGLPGLDILPSGPRPSNPAELLASPRFSQLLAWAASIYDQVLIDSPPGLATSDTALIGRLVDGVVLVVQPAKNRRGLVVRVADGLSMLKIPLLGVIVNRVGAHSDNAYYGYHGNYGYGYGYGYGGYGYGGEEEATSPKGRRRRPAAETAEAGQLADRGDAEADGPETEPPGRIVPRRAA